MAQNCGGVPAHNVFTFGDVTFSSNFDNGNLARVEQVPNKSFEFRIWTAPDNLGTPHQSKHCAWYYFMVTGLPQGCVLRIQIVNASNHAGLYKFDMRPVYRSNSTNQKWMRIKSSVRFTKDITPPQLYFEHGVEQANEKLYFAFTFPYTYSMLQNELEEFDTRHANNLSEADSVFYQREVITRSLDGRRIDLLTITAPNGVCESEREPLLSGLFPDTKQPSDRPPVFREKEVVFVSARVHPGEVPAQHTFKGIVNLLMDPNDLRAKELRARYVFKLIPMLNPDGVYRGHFRMDQLGQNLNRYYIDSDAMLQPSVFAAKSLTDYYAKQNKLAVYLDFHAHASKRGCFIYGNVLDSPEDQIQNQLYCKLIALNSAHFDYEGCLFSREHMTRIDPGDQAKGLTAEGSGRVSMYLAHGIIHSYTIECNYNTSRVGNEIAPTDCDPGGSAVTPASPFTTNPEKYTPATFAGVGRACVIALLDIRGHNPCSRISKSKFKTLDRVRNSVMMEVRSRKEYIGKAVNRERRRSMVALERRGNGGEVAVSMDDLCWRRVVEAAAAAAEAQPLRGSSAGPSPVPTGAPLQSASAKDPPAKSGDVFFVSMKDGREQRRRQRSASAAQVPVSNFQMNPGAPGFSRGSRSNAGSTENSSAGSSRSDTPLREICTAVPPRSATTMAPTPTPPAVPLPSRPSVRTEANSTYVPTKALMPHLARRPSAAETGRSNEAMQRDLSSGKMPSSGSQRELAAHGLRPVDGARASTPTLQVVGSIAPHSPPDLMVVSKRADGPGSSAGSVAGTMLSSSGKAGRNILGKKLHAAGVALVMGNNSHSFSSLDMAQKEATDAQQSDTLEALSGSAARLRVDTSTQRPASSGGRALPRTRDAVASTGIAIQEDFSYALSPQPRLLSPMHHTDRDPYATSPVKSLRSPLASPSGGSFHALPAIATSET